MAQEATADNLNTQMFEPEFRTLGLGQHASELAVEGYDFFACGSSGGPPLKTIDGWADFMECDADGHGLHEVYVEFGRRIQMLADLYQDEYGGESWIQKYGGTRIANFPVVLSLLFDDDGITRGFRAVTDDRAAVHDRSAAYLFRFRIYPLYGSDGWDCVDIPPRPGETGVGNTYLNQTCTKTVSGKFIQVDAHFFRKPGQTGLDINGQFEEGQYESMTRWEVYDASLHSEWAEAGN